MAAAEGEKSGFYREAATCLSERDASRLARAASLHQLVRRRAHTRHRDGRSLDAYASGARPDYAALVARLSPEFPPSGLGGSQEPGIKKENGGGGGNRTRPLTKRIHSPIQKRPAFGTPKCTPRWPTLWAGEMQPPHPTPVSDGGG